MDGDNGVDFCHSPVTARHARLKGSNGVDSCPSGSERWSRKSGHSGGRPTSTATRPNAGRPHRSPSNLIAVRLLLDPARLALVGNYRLKTEWAVSLAAARVTRTQSSARSWFRPKTSAVDTDRHRVRRRSADGLAQQPTHRWKTLELPETKLRRSIGPFQLTLYGLGSMLGSGIYGLIGQAAGRRCPMRRLGRAIRERVVPPSSPSVPSACRS